MSDEERRLLFRLRLVATGVVIALLVYAVLFERDLGLVGTLCGALFVLLSLAGVEALARRNGT